MVRLGEEAVIEVVDHGTGVAPRERDMIFEPFWRKKEISPGSGLGLSVAKELVELQRGSIFVQDTPAAARRSSYRCPASEPWKKWARPALMKLASVG